VSFHHGSPPGFPHKLWKLSLSLCCQLAIREELKGQEEMRQVILVQKPEYDPIMNQWFLVLRVDSMFPIL
jgi:hypothetical protein